MALATTILAVLLVLALVVSSLADLAKVPSLVETMQRLGVPVAMLPVLATIKLCGAVGLIVGWWSGPVQVVTGIAVAVYFALAVAMHTRVGDSRSDTGAAMVLLALATAHMLTALAS